VRTRALLLALLPLAWLAGCGPGEVPNLQSSGTTVVCLGDSITAGVGARPEESYPAHLEALLGVPVVNAGVPGDTTADALARLGGVLAHDPWLVIVELGGNDLLSRRPAAEAEADLAALVEGLLAAGSAVVLVETRAPLFGGDYDELSATVARRFDLPLVGEVVGEVLGDPARKSDQIHPNAAGYRDIARAVAHVVEPLLRERRRLGLSVAPPEAA
jgi:lysophospholipase L1-like esterase